MIQPRNEYVLIERIDPLQSGFIVIPEVAQETSLLGKVLAVGTGKREPSESYKMGVIWTPDENGIQQPSGGQWVEFPSHRRPVLYKPGDIVYFHSKWSDLSGSHYSADQLYDRNLHLIQEADVFLKVANAPDAN